MEDRGSETNAITWLFTLASLCVVLLRLYSRTRLSGSAGWDDILISIALIIVIFANCLVSYSVSIGLGKHIYDLTPGQAIEAARWTTATDTVLIFTFTTPKLPVAVLLDRIITAGIPSNVLRAFLYVPACIMVAWSFSACGLYLGQCRPVFGLWNMSEGQSCLSPKVYRDFATVYGCASATTDFFYAIFPTVFISRLNMELRRKVHLAIMLGLGCLGGAVAIWKTTNIPTIFAPGADKTYVSALLCYATLIESNCLIIAACIPTLSPFARKVQEKATLVSTKLFRDSQSYHQFFDDPARPSSARPETRAFAHGLGPVAVARQANNELELGALSKPQGEELQELIEEQIVAETTIDVSMDTGPQSSQPLHS